MAEELCLEACRLILGEDACRHATLTKTIGGVNNIVYYVDLGQERHIVRVYNNGEDLARVKFEHAVLKALAESGRAFSFQLPTPLVSSPGGSTFVHLSNGAEASLFHLIPGTLPKLSHVREIGRASGELAMALFHLKVDLKSPTAPYWDLYKVHHAVSRDKFVAELQGSAFNEVRSETNFLLAELADLEGRLVEYHSMNLSCSLIHGDLHYDNILCHQGKVSGVLDFEFCAWDWRAMEIAICLSKYLSEPDPLPFLTDFILGYAEHGRLSKAEVSAVPALIKLRILSNVIYFVGRALAGEDAITALTSRLASYARRVQFLNSSSDELLKALGVMREN